MMKNPLTFFARRRDAKLKNELGSATQFHSYDVGGGKYKTINFPLDAARSVIIPTIYAATSIISNTLARVRFQVVDTNNYNQPVDHYLNQFFKKPYRDWDGGQFWRYVFDKLVAHGNGYAEIVRGSGGRIIEMIPVFDAAPQRFFPEFRDANGVLRRSTRSEIYYTNVKPLGVEANNYTVRAQNMLAFHGPHWDGLRAPSPVGSILKSIATQLNSYHRQGIIALEHGFIDKPLFQTSADMWELLTDENKELFHKNLQEFESDPIEFQDGPVLPPGFTRNTLSSFPSSAFSLEAWLRYQTLEICRTINCPPRAIYLYSEGQRVEPKLASTMADLVRNCILTRTQVAIDPQMTSKCLSNQERNRGLAILGVTEHLMRGTPQEQYELFNLAVTRSAALMVNEGRIKFLDEAPLPGQDRFINPTGTADQTDETNPNNPPEDQDNA